MDGFYDKLPPDAAAEIEQLSRLMYEVRCARDTRLTEIGATDAESALARIASGELPEHPSYEHYLSARILAQLQSDIRADLAERLKETNK